MWVLVIGALSLFPALSIGSAVAGAQTSSPTLAVSPSSGLTDGQQVQVSGSNLPAGTNQLAECTLQGCDAAGTGLAVSPDGSGTLAPTQYQVHQNITINGSPVNCAASTCAVAAVGGSVGGFPPFVIISFGAATVTGTVTGQDGIAYPNMGAVACPPSEPVNPNCPGAVATGADPNHGGAYTLNLSPGSYNVAGFLPVNNGQQFSTSAPVLVTLASGDTAHKDFIVPVPVAPTQMNIAACPSVTQTTVPGYGVGPGDLGCGPQVFSPSTVIVQPDGTCPPQTNSSLGARPATQNPLGLWVQVDVVRLCQTGAQGYGALGGSFTISLTQSAPTPGPTQTIPGQLGMNPGAPPGVPAPAGAVIPIGNLAPGTYNVTVKFPAQTICSQPGSCPGFGPHPVGATSATGTLVVFANSSGGAFVIGDQNASVGNSVTFWGAQWAKQNSLSGGSAPNSFKGFADTPATAPGCGTQWATGPGNSSAPPDTVPAYMAVIVTSSVTKSGSTISGNTTKLVIVKTDPGYAGNPGHAGTGTVVAVLPCS